MNYRGAQDSRQHSTAGNASPVHDKYRVLRYIAYTTVEDLEQAVAKLPPDQLAKFRDWFVAFEAACFDDKIERDAKAGKLDCLAEQALDDFRQGRARQL